MARDQGHPFQPYAPSPWGISRPGVSSCVSTRVKNGNLVWCDKDGNEWSDDKEMDKARRSGKGYVKISDSYTPADTIGLPTPFDLTGDPDWDVGGELYQMYDLELECGDAGDNGDMEGDKDSGGSLNTSDDSYNVDNIKDNGDSGKGFKVLSKRSHKEIKKMIRESAKKKKQEQKPYDPNDAETQKLYEEFGDILRVKKDLKNPGNEPGRPETPCFEVNNFTQDIDEYFEQDEDGEVDIPVDTHAAFSERMLAFAPC